MTTVANAQANVNDVARQKLWFSARQAALFPDCALRLFVSTAAVKTRLVNVLG